MLNIIHSRVVDYRIMATENPAKTLKLDAAPLTLNGSESESTGHRRVLVLEDRETSTLELERRLHLLHFLWTVLQIVHDDSLERAGYRNPSRLQ